MDGVRSIARTQQICIRPLEDIVHRVDYDLLLSFAGLDSAAQKETRDALARDKDANEYLLESFCMHSPDERLSLVNKGLSISPRNNGLLKMRRMLTGNRE